MCIESLVFDSCISVKSEWLIYAPPQVQDQWLMLNYIGVSIVSIYDLNIPNSTPLLRPRVCCTERSTARYDSKLLLTLSIIIQGVDERPEAYIFFGSLQTFTIRGFYTTSYSLIECAFNGITVCKNEGFQHYILILNNNVIAHQGLGHFTFHLSECEHKVCLSPLLRHEKL